MCTKSCTIANYDLNFLKITPCDFLIVPFNTILQQFMRKLLSILLLSLMMVQAIPVMQCLSSEKGILYTYVEEEKPNDTKEIKEGKEYLSFAEFATEFSDQAKFNITAVLHTHSSPLLEYITPPPDGC